MTITTLFKRFGSISLAAAAIMAVAGCSDPTSVPSDTELSADLERNYAEYTSIVAQCQEHPALREVDSTDEESSWHKPEQYAELSSAERALYDSMQAQLDKTGTVSVTCVRDTTDTKSPLRLVAFELYFDLPGSAERYMHKGVVYDFEDTATQKSAATNHWFVPMNRKNWFIYGDKLNQ